MGDSVARGIELIEEHLADSGLSPVEPASSPEQLAFLRNLCRRTDSRTVAETGFNAGHSSIALLLSGPKTRVVSFDMGEHPYVESAKAFLDNLFPGRHTLILGDSRETVPAYGRARPDVVFDLVYVDGGHDYEVASADVVNFGRLVRESAGVVVDDLAPWEVWGAGPARAWEEAIDSGLIHNHSLYMQPAPDEPVRRIDRMEPPTYRIWGTGSYRGPGRLT
jgi:predicted O-methyltransferase YrrM